ncbi:hypothetical protein D3C76_1530000 [compost metagenome]
MLASVLLGDNLSNRAIAFFRDDFTVAVGPIGGFGHRSGGLIGDGGSRTAVPVLGHRRRYGWDGGMASAVLVISVASTAVVILIYTNSHNARGCITAVCSGRRNLSSAGSMNGHMTVCVHSSYSRI